MRFPSSSGITTVRRAVLALLVVWMAVVTACASGGDKPAANNPPAASNPNLTSAPTPAFPYAVASTDGGTLKLNKAPERIVSLSPGSTEILFSIGAGPSVVAADRFSDFPEAAQALPKVEYTRPSIESLAAFRPDLIVGSGRQKDTVAAIQNAGLPVVLLDEPASVAGVIDRIRLFGKITGRTAEAEKLATAMETRIRAVTEKLAGVSKGPSVFHEISFSAGTYTATSKSFVGDMYTLLKARNIADSAGADFPQVSQEVVVQADPEVIVLADGREGATIEQVRARPGWSTISAVKNNRIYLLTPMQEDVTSRPGPRVVDGLEQLAKLLYPDKF